MHAERSNLIQSQTALLSTWLTSREARLAVRSELSTNRLPARERTVDDVLAGVFERVWKRIREEPLDERDSTTVVAYARRAIRNAVVDLLRAPQEASLDELLTQGWEPTMPGATDTIWEYEVEAARPGDSVSDFRRALHLQLSQRYVQTWYISAALVVVALSQDDLDVAADIPCPNASHGGAANPAMWAALAYAGQQRCFEQPESHAVRERRSRAMGQVAETVSRAIALAHDSTPKMSQP